MHFEKAAPSRWPPLPGPSLSTVHPYSGPRLIRFVAGRNFGEQYKGRRGEAESDGAVPIELLHDDVDRAPD